MAIDFTALSAIVGLTTAIVAVVALWLENRRSRIAMQCYGLN